MRFVLLPSAKEDLMEIKQYISKENPTASKMVSERIKKSFIDANRTAAYRACY